MGRAGSRWQGCVTRRLRTVTKIFKNMYLSDRTAARPVPVPVPSANRSLLPSFLPPSVVPRATCTYVPTYPRESWLFSTRSRYIYFAFPSCLASASRTMPEGMLAACFFLLLRDPPLPPAFLSSSLIPLPSWSDPKLGFRSATGTIVYTCVPNFWKRQNK